MLRNNQLDAINASKNNNFKSGIHFHATGTGKSWIALNIILEYNKNKKNNLIFWITEKKSILIEQFSKLKIIENGYESIYDDFLIQDYSQKKNLKWYECINSSKIWGKSRLIIINRAFLTSAKKYEKIIENIDLIIHDECHSIVNKSTQDFYKFQLSKNNKINCIGLTATPYLDIKPFDNIISSYSIFQAVLDNVIVPPRICWLKSDEKINYDDVYNILKEMIA